MSTNEDNYHPLEADLDHNNGGIESGINSVTGDNRKNNLTDGLNSAPSASDLYLYNRLNRIDNDKLSSAIFMKELPLLSSGSKADIGRNDATLNANETNYSGNISQANIEAQLINKLDPTDPADLVLDDRNITRDTTDVDYNGLPNNKPVDNNELTDILDNNDINDKESTPDQPFYVNAKQYYRILKRRYARARLEENLRISRERRPYLHESRHKHAMRRPRGQGGRFLTAAEIEELKSKGRIDENGDVIPDDKELDNTEQTVDKPRDKTTITKIANKDDEKRNKDINDNNSKHISITSETMPLPYKK
ncbi:Transcriptional activator [Maudiozyma exigua]|uniref:Transcriptional activator HAP2 n=1 Tax=Maudiozyma exigua TaxID=34358 RepID=A0A9P7BAY7_MAUEX|nr:Transcriptional activator [Kazachstania exigua]